MLQEPINQTFKKELRVLALGFSSFDHGFIQKSLGLSQHYLCKIRYEKDYQEVLSIINGDEVGLLIWKVSKSQGEQELELMKQFQQYCPILAFCDRKNENLIINAMQHQVLDGYYVKQTKSPLSFLKAFCESLEKRRISHQIKLIRKLIKTEESFRRVISESSDGIVIVDPLNQVLFINPKAEDLFQLNTLQILNMPFPEDLRKEKVWIKELEHSMDKSLYVQFQTVPISWDGQDCFLCTIRDISSRILLEKKKDDFFSVISHEIRTPITVIKEGLHQVIDGLHGEINDKQKMFLDLALDSTNELNTLITNLLDLSKLEVQKTTLDWDPCKLSATVNKVVQKFRIPGEKKGLRVDAVLPETDPEIFLDAGKITQVLTNLMSNALKFTEQGSIELHLIDKPHEIEISVQDSGVGIPQKDIQRVFDRFEQVGRDSNSGTQGTGLGLAICKGIVELHGGKIWAQQGQEVGTEFHFTLPKKEFQDICRDYVEEYIEKIEEGQLFWTMLLESSETEKSKTNQWFKLIQHTLRSNSDFYLKNNEKIFIILFDVKSLTPEAFKERLSSIEAQVQISVSHKLARFPEDGKTSHALLQKINL